MHVEVLVLVNGLAKLVGRRFFQGNDSITPFRLDQRRT
jgi:hypothetical protein